ncbi:MAG: tRNA lysidine(34) synthetase TilS [Opitutales bacterium]
MKKTDGGILGSLRHSWSEKAEALAAHFPRERLHPAVSAWIAKAPPRGFLGAACSAGADSMTLLLLLWAHYPQRRGEWTVLHFNHRLRGVDSDREADFVEEVAGCLGVKFRRGEWENPQSGEAAARRARFQFFEQALVGSGQGGVFFGHQRDDIAESLLMRISRGSGAAGLAAPRPAHAFPNGRIHLRPLLDLGAAEIREALKRLKIPFYEDASNRDEIYFRNRIRHSVIPGWREASPSDPCAGAARTREQMEEDEEALSCWLEEILPDPPQREGFRVVDLRGKPRALLRRALYRWLIVCKCLDALSQRAFEQLFLAVEAGTPLKMSAGAGAWIVFSGEQLGFRTKPSEREWGESEVILPVGASLLLPGGGEVSARWFEWSESLQRELEGGAVDPANTVFLSPDAPSIGSFLVRRWRAGDRYRPLGAPGGKKLHDAFINRKIDVEERIRLPLVCLLDGAIAWCPGLPPADFLKIRGLPKQVVQLTYKFSRPV